MHSKATGGNRGTAIQHKDHCGSLVPSAFLAPHDPVSFAFKALVSDAAEDAKAEVSLILPPCHEDADKPEDVYKFEDRIFWGTINAALFQSRQTLPEV